MAHTTETAHDRAPRTYSKVLASLITLTVITVAAASVNWGSLNVVIALTIATVKASLVALFFMHLLHDKPMNAIIFTSGIVFLGIFLTFCFLDTDTRGELRPSVPVRTQATTPAPAK